MTDKKAIECAVALAEFCQSQRGCQNCIFRDYACDHWDCNIPNINKGKYFIAGELCDVQGCYEAKRKKGGYID